jgi:hypothetical protein
MQGTFNWFEYFYFDQSNYVIPVLVHYSTVASVSEIYCTCIIIIHELLIKKILMFSLVRVMSTAVHSI